MQGPPKHNRHQPNKAQERRVSRCMPLCCTRRLSDSSVDELECRTAHHPHPPVSSMSALRQGKRMAEPSFAVMVAVEKSSSDPREDFRSSMVEMIVESWIEEPKDLRYLLKCYVEMNAEEHRAVILETFYEVCSHMFKS